jgi:hypothetical protein
VCSARTLTRSTVDSRAYCRQALGGMRLIL